MLLSGQFLLLGGGVRSRSHVVEERQKQESERKHSRHSDEHVQGTMQHMHCIMHTAGLAGVCSDDFVDKRVKLVKLVRNLLRNLHVNVRNLRNL